VRIMAISLLVLLLTGCATMPNCVSRGEYAALAILDALTGGSQNGSNGTLCPANEKP
jgi:hypothetical protein